MCCLRSVGYTVIQVNVFFCRIEIIILIIRTIKVDGIGQYGVQEWVGLVVKFECEYCVKLSA